MGDVQLFREGRWGRICSGGSSSRFQNNCFGEFGIVAQVICRQLGFRFGTVMDSRGQVDADGRQENGDPEPVPIWATSVGLTQLK